MTAGQFGWIKIMDGQRLLRFFGRLFETIEGQVDWGVLIDGTSPTIGRYTGVGVEHS